MDKKQQYQFQPMESMKESTPQAVKPKTCKSDNSSMCEDKCRCKSPVDPVVASGLVRLGSLGRVLRLNLKHCYWDAIKEGLKTKEYRLASKWESKLAGKAYDDILLLKGYPKRGDETRQLRRRWNGYTVEWITHPHFGDSPVRVLAIDVAQHSND